MNSCKVDELVNELVIDFMSMENIYNSIKLNMDKFFNFMSNSFMNHIDDTNMTTTDLYVFLSRVYGSYNIFVQKVFQYPFKKRRRLMVDPFSQISPEQMKEALETPEEQPMTEFCVVSLCKPEPPKQFKLDTDPFNQYKYLMDIESRYGLISDILNYLMKKLFSYKFKTIIDKKINIE